MTAESLPAAQAAEHAASTGAAGTAAAATELHAPSKATAAEAAGAAAAGAGTDAVQHAAGGAPATQAPAATAATGGSLYGAVRSFMVSPPAPPKKPAAPRVLPSRPSIFDVDRMEQAQDPLLGVFIISQVAVVLFIATSCHGHYLRTGTLFDPDVFSLFFDGLLALAFWDARLVFSAAPALLVQQFVAGGFVPLATAWPLQASWEAVWLAVWVGTIRTSSLAWPHRLVLALHMVVLLMKQHSYFAVNNEWLQSAGAGAAASSDAARQATSSEKPEAEKATPAREDVTKSLTIGNFMFWLAVPSLVYETSFRQMPHFRLIHFIYYLVWTLISAFGLYVTVDHLAYPAVRDFAVNGYINTFMLLVPAMAMYVVLIFLTISEFGLNTLAELTRFDDREFYGDWWNAIGYESFSRKWFTPVHRFLHAHVFAASRQQLGLSRPAAMVLAFTVSAFLHELVMFAVLPNLHIDLFRTQILQVTYIWMDFKMPPARASYGITSFWGGYFLGPPFWAIAYSRAFFETPAPQ
ncbi:Sterol O-acyltransferase 2 (Sterol-ester synthase 2) [Polyrhizophydium stewartii]|uniref:Sterol O-acyltransferase 2 (Sterol-ester synthase 2) n=1 Tax=Polyrhizophydium stewartii TaxID=2732419 RepID=A0ABR4NKR4_9FUNG|nr:acyl-CoA/sterol acyltransferase [Polyrhizophydium stewartii]